MTPAERATARQALGLPNASGVSVTNRGSCPPQPDALAILDRMVRNGLARCTGSKRTCGRSRIRLFELTRAGAERAIEPGERLDPSHFPPIGQD